MAEYDDAQLDEYRQKFGNFGRAIAPLPDSLRTLVERKTNILGGRYWQIIISSGHSSEHATLCCPALKLLISGDQALPRITPNVSVFPTEPEGDPPERVAAFQYPVKGDSTRRSVSTSVSPDTLLWTTRPTQPVD